MKVNKSSRHAKITGDFGEALIMYWLSKYGFECARVDHTGIDIIADNPHTQEIMGISVKSRSRTETTESDYVRIPNEDFDKVEKACKAFGCVPYFAFVIDAGKMIRAFILPMNHLLEISPRKKQTSSVHMGRHWLEKYADDPQIKTFEFSTKTTRWWHE